VVAKDEGLELRLDDKTVPMALKEIPAAVLKAQAGKPPGTSAVVISADRNVKYESVVKVMDALQRAGVQRVGLSVQLAK
jgi:biopolymer transport protein TolR